MRQGNYYINICLILLICFLYSCSGISITQKRYNSGFNLEWDGLRRDKDTGVGFREHRIAELKKKTARTKNEARVIPGVFETPFEDFTSSQHTARLFRMVHVHDTDSIVYYKKPKKIKPLKPGKTSQDSLSVPRKDNSIAIPEQAGGVYEKNATLAIVLFFTSIPLMFVGAGFLCLIAAGIVASRSRRYFRQHPESTLKGRGWADFIYIFFIIDLILAIILTIFIIFLILSLLM